MTPTANSRGAPPDAFGALAPPRVLVVDDEPIVAGFLARLLAREGCLVTTAHDGRSALASIAAHPPDVVLLDIMMPDLDGYEICRRVRREPGTRLTPIVLVTALSAREAKIRGLDAGADEVITKPVDSQELLARVRSLTHKKRYTDDLDSATSFAMTLGEMIEARDGSSEGHGHRLANYATAVGRSLQLGSDNLQALYRGGFLHDIGMLAIPEAVLRRPGVLEPEEYELIKSHTLVGDSLVGQLRSLRSVRPIIRSHHERLDGSGYPDHLQGDAIPLLAQIVGLVDTYDAVTTRRPYREAKPIEEGVAALQDQARRGWRRADLVDLFVSLIESGKVV